MKENHIAICWQCKNADYLDTLDFYDIKCNFDGSIRDENSSCDHFEYDPNHSEINPRLSE